MPRLILNDSYYVFKKLIFVSKKNLFVKINDFDDLLNIETIALKVRKYQYECIFEGLFLVLTRIKTFRHNC